MNYMARVKETHYLIWQQGLAKEALEEEKANWQAEGRKVVVIREGKRPAAAGLRAVIEHHLMGTGYALEQDDSIKRGGI